MDEVSIEDLTAVAAALKQWERTQARSVPAKSTKAKEPCVWRRKWQAPVTSSLGVLIIRAQVRAAMDAGLIRRGGGSTDGWHLQVLDGESPYQRPALE